MFSRVTSILLPGSPTFQSNNLSSHSDLICFTRLSEVSIVDDNKFLKISLTRSQLSEVLNPTHSTSSCTLDVALMESVKKVEATHHNSRLLLVSFFYFVNLPSVLV